MSEGMSDGAATAYQRIYDASLRDPEGFWRAAAEGIDWVTPPTRILDDSRPPFYRWYPDAELNVCFNAVDRHVAAGRGEQAAIHYDSPVTGTKSTMTYAVLLERVRAVAGGLRGLGVEQGRPGRHLHADGPRGRHRHARLRPHRRHPLRRVRRLRARRSSPRASTTPRPKVVLSASCGVEPSRVVPYKPFLDEAIRRSEHQPEHCVVLQREQPVAELGERDIDWADFESGDGRPRGQRVRHGRGDRPALHPLHVRHDREAQGHLPRQRGLRRGAAVVDGQPLRRRARARRCSPRATSAGSSATPTSSTRRCSPGRRPSSTRASRSAHPTPARSGGSSPSTAPSACSPRRRRSAPSRRRTRRRPRSPTTTSRASATLFLAGERLDPDTYEWASAALGKPVIDNWWQTETGWPIAANPKGIGLLPIKPGSPTVAGAGLRRAGPRRHG